MTLGTEAKPQAPRPYFCNIGTQHHDVPDVEISGAWVVVSLEIVLEKEDLRFLALRLNAYPNPDGDRFRTAEGYWAPPNMQFPHFIDSEQQLPNPTQIEARLRDEVESNRLFYENRERGIYIDSAIRLAESFGLRGVSVKQVGVPIFEVKPSNNNPDYDRGFYTMRYRLTKADENTLVNLADYEGRHGFVFLELGDGPAALRGLLAKGPIMDDPNRTLTPCIKFLGKPVISTVTRLIEDRQGSNELFRLDSFAIPSGSFSRFHQGIICAADVAGYGTAMSQKLTALTTRPRIERKDFREKILGNLESHLKSLGTLEVQSAGDGFIAAFPKWKNLDTPLTRLHFVLNRWSECIFNIEDQINSIIDDNDDDFQVGSRMAICFGDYWYGRINGMASFFSSFDGENVVKAARMEQGLNDLIRKCEPPRPEAADETVQGEIVDGPSAFIDPVTPLTEDGTPFISRKRNHYAIVGGTAVDYKRFESSYPCETGTWSLLMRSCDVKVKEFDTADLREKARKRKEPLEFFALYQWRGLDVGPEHA